MKPTLAELARNAVRPSRVDGPQPARRRAPLGRVRPRDVTGRGDRRRERERRHDQVRPAPAERDRHAGQREPGEDGADRRARLLGPEGEAATGGGDLVLERRAHGRARDGVAEAGRRQDADQARGAVRGRGHRRAAEGRQRRAGAHARDGSDPLHETSQRRREDHADEVEGGGREAQRRAREVEVVANPGSERRGQEARQRTRGHERDARDERAPPSPSELVCRSRCWRRDAGRVRSARLGAAGVEPLPPLTCRRGVDARGNRAGHRPGADRVPADLQHRSSAHRARRSSVGRTRAPLSRL